VFGIANPDTQQIANLCYKQAGLWIVPPCIAVASRMFPPIKKGGKPSQPRCKVGGNMQLAVILQEGLLQAVGGQPILQRLMLPFLFLIHEAEYSLVLAWDVRAKLEHGSNMSRPNQADVFGGIKENYEFRIMNYELKMENGELGI
jgi:hypothetical protein